MLVCHECAQLIGMVVVVIDASVYGLVPGIHAGDFNAVLFPIPNAISGSIRTIAVEHILRFRRLGVYRK